MNSNLKIGMTGHFEDGDAVIKGRIVFVDEDGTKWNHWQLETSEGESFWIREYMDEGNSCYEILSAIEAEEEGSDVDGSDDIADEIFSDWRNFSNLAMRSSVKIETVEGELVEAPSKEDMLKIADISFCEEGEEELELEEDEVLVDTCIIWSADNTWVYGVEYLEEADIKKMFA